MISEGAHETFDSRVVYTGAIKVAQISLGGNTKTLSPFYAGALHYVIGSSQYQQAMADEAETSCLEAKRCFDMLAQVYEGEFLKMAPDCVYHLDQMLESIKQLRSNMAKDEEEEEVQTAKVDVKSAGISSKAAQVTEPSSFSSNDIMGRDEHVARPEVTVRGVGFPFGKAFYIIRIY